MSGNIFKLKDRTKLLSLLKNLDSDDFVVLTLFLEDTDEKIKNMIISFLKEKAQQYYNIKFLFYSVKYINGKLESISSTIFPKNKSDYPFIIFINNSNCLASGTSVKNIKILKETFNIISDIHDRIFDDDENNEEITLNNNQQNNNHQNNNQQTNEQQNLNQQFMNMMANFMGMNNNQQNNTNNEQPDLKEQHKLVEKISLFDGYRKDFEKDFFKDIAKRKKIEEKKNKEKSSEENAEETKKNKTKRR